MTHYVNPTSDSFKAFRDLPRDAPVHMLNLLRYRAHADYPADMPEATQGLTGAQAYARYGETTEAIFQRVGGSIIWAGAPQVVVTGPADEHWDSAFIAAYPTAQAFLDMLRDADYQLHVRHRTAAVETSRLICMSPRLATQGFA
jgi:uncharacterized protein (DUF1330 family)